ncbi:hypothetical protein QFZ97_001179 [Paraburkholderia youngii]
MRKTARFNPTTGSRKRDAGSIAIRYLPAMLILLLLAVNAFVLGIVG